MTSAASFSLRPLYMEVKEYLDCPVPSLLAGSHGLGSATLAVVPSTAQGTPHIR